MLKKTIAWVLSFALLAGAIPLCAAAEEETASDNDKLSQEIIEEINEGKEKIPVSLYLDLSDVKNGLQERKQSLEALKEQLAAQTEELRKQTAEAWQKVQNGEMTREEFDTWLAEKKAALKEKTAELEQYQALYDKYEQYAKTAAEELQERKQSLQALKEQVAAQTEELRQQTAEAWQKVQNCEMTREDFDTWLAEKKAALKEKSAELEQYQALYDTYEQYVKAATEKLQERKQSLDALKEQLAQEREELRKQAAETWKKVQNGEMTREEFDAWLAEKNAALKEKSAELKQKQEQYEQDAKAAAEELLKNKLSELGLDTNLTLEDITDKVHDANDRVTTVLKGYLTPEQIEALSKLKELICFKYDPEDPEQSYEASLDVPEFVFGDFNRDNAVNASDAAIMLQYAAKHGAGEVTVSFAASVKQQEPVVIQTDKFLYYSTMPYHEEDLSDGGSLGYADKLVIKDTDANFLVTGIYQDQENPENKTYTVVGLNSSATEPCYLNGWNNVAGGDTLQIGDLISLKNAPVVETYPGEVECGSETEYTNYGNACEVLGEEFRDVIRHQMLRSQYYVLCSNERFQMLSAPEQIGDYKTLMTEQHDLYGDYNHDGEVNASDAAYILIYAAEHGAGSYNGTFKDYLSK